MSAPDPNQTHLWVNPDLGQTRVLAHSDVSAKAEGYALSPTDSTEHFALTAVGNYRIVEMLGEGAMGTVYRAVRESTGRVVALKVLSKSVAQRSGFAQRFHREIRTMGRLTHPNIVRYLAAGEADGQVYLSMELVDGGNVGDLVKRQGKLSVVDAMSVTIALGRALDYAHQNGVIHRDVKPDNLLLTLAGEVKLADLGLAKVSDEETDASLTGTGTGMGTPLYAPIEQIRDAKRADARSDLFALGGVLYCCLTGAPPFIGSNLLDLLKAKERGTFPTASSRNKLVPPAIDKMINKLLAKLPEHRYQSAAEFLQDAEWAGFTPGAVIG